MIKEDSRFKDSTVFEGMTSIRAIIKGMDDECNSRRIVTVLYDKDKRAKNAKTLGYLKAVSQKYGFVFVYAFGERIEVKGFYDCKSAFRFGTPTLAIDVCEHVYFMDYGFDKERYLVSSLPYLDISKLR